MKSKLINLFIALLLLAAAAVLLYPTSSDQIARYQNQMVINTNRELVEGLSEEERQAMLAEARAYNEELASRRKLSLPDAFSEEEGEPDPDTARYLSLLRPGEDGMMGIVTVPKAGIELPIWHTTADSVLQTGAGHLEGTSLPVGGPSTHAALAGHRGLPSARLFTDLDVLEVGDLFEVTVLAETLTYQVDQILVVGPKDTQYLNIVPGEDRVTLVTCTPYGINTHRLLIQGVRIFPEEQADIPISTLLAQDGGAAALGDWQALAILGAPLFVAGLILLLIAERILRRREKRRKA